MRPAAVARPAAFLDRDGTIIVDRHYPADPDAVELLPGAAEAVRMLNGAGLLVVVVTNQSGIGRGYYGATEFEAVQQRMLEMLASAGAHIDATYHCPHAPDALPPCDCRKPFDGLFRRAAADLAIDLRASCFVGDRSRDVAAAGGFGARAFLIGPAGQAPTYAAEPVRSLLEAACRFVGRTVPVDDAGGRIYL
jgi:D-glycero-D-manno-heptose 1,7-bisphosphate phosphatase